MAKILRSKIPYSPPSTENLIELIRSGLSCHSDEIIIIDSTTSTQWSGREIESAIARVAYYITQECNLKKGDVCSIYAEESDMVAILILAIAATGGVSNFLTSKSSGREVHDTASVLNSKFLFTTKDLLTSIKSDISDIRHGLKLICIDQVCDKICEDCHTIGDLYSKSCSKPEKSLTELCKEIQICPENDYAVIQFSSGTTGKPKPIPRTHKNLCHLVASVNHQELMDLRPGVVMTGSLPITHRPGLWALLASVVCGSTFVIWSNLSDVENALATIEKFKITAFSSSLPFLSMLGNIGIKIKDRYDTSSWREIFTSGAKIVNPELPKQLIDQFGLRTIRQCFGMTESGWVFLVENSLAKDKYLTVGHVVPGMEAMIIDRNDLKPLEAFARGEVVLRGPQVFPGYLTSVQGELNRSDFIEGDWFRIGDQAYYDDNEFVTIEGRYKEVMMFENNSLYFPTEIEAIICEHPAIEGVCVVKVAEVRQDYPYDVARAFITIKQGHQVTEQEIIEFVLKNSPQVILGAGVKILDKFPRLQNGKVDKQSLSRDK